MTTMYLAGMAGGALCVLFGIYAERHWLSKYPRKKP